MSSLTLGFLFIALPIFGFASGCNILLSGLTPRDKGLVLRLHNHFRNRTAAGKTPRQPPAANMLEMVWNEELAALAQNWTDNCVFQHDPNLDFHGGTFGQNLAIIMTSSKKEGLYDILVKLVTLWFEEYINYIWNDDVKTNTGHYTQLVWNDSRKCGCGFTIFMEGSWYKYYLACNYFRSGNYAGKSPYVPGPLNCSKYGLIKSTKYPFLCTL